MDSMPVTLTKGKSVFLELSTAVWNTVLLGSKSTKS